VNDVNDGTWLYESDIADNDNNHYNNRYAISQAWVEVHISNYSLSQDFQGFLEFPGHSVFPINNDRYSWRQELSIVSDFCQSIAID